MGHVNRVIIVQFLRIDVCLRIIYRWNVGRTNMNYAQTFVNKSVFGRNSFS